MIRLLANENIPIASVRYLRNKGFDVSAIGEDNPSISDQEVLEIAQSEQRTIITFDRDYGELIFRHGFRPEKGVIYLRLLTYEPDEPGKVVESIIQNMKFKPDGSLTVFDRVTLRQRRY